MIGDIIRTRAPEFPQQTTHSGLLLTYLVGDLLVILADADYIVGYTPYQTPTPSLGPSIYVSSDPMTFGSIFTSYHYLTPTMTPGMTAFPSRTTRVIIYSRFFYILYYEFVEVMPSFFLYFRQARLPNGV